MKRSGNPGLSGRNLAFIYNTLFKTSGILRDLDVFYKLILNKIDLCPPKKLLDVTHKEGVVVKGAHQRGTDGIGADFSIIGNKIAPNQVDTNVITLAKGKALPFYQESFDVVIQSG